MSSTYQNRCYQADEMPLDEKQNCVMWEYDQTKDLYITSYIVREAVYYLTPMIMYFFLQHTARCLDSNVIGQSFLGSLVSYSLKAFVPITAFKRKALLEINDFFYRLLHKDEILEDTKFFNKFLGWDGEEKNDEILTNVQDIEIAGDNAVQEE